MESSDDEPKEKRLKVEENELKNEDELKKEDELKEEDELKKEDELKEEDELKKEDSLKVNEKDRMKRGGKEEEEQFVKLFDAVLEENRGNLSDNDIEEGVIITIQEFQGGISKTVRKEKYNNPKSLCGLFHRLSPLYAGKTRRSIAAALLKCEELRSYFHRSSLKIVDVGSGAGSDLVGLYSAIYDWDFPFQSLEVTAMDNNEHWKNFFDSITNKLHNEKYNFGNASNLFKEKDVECTFVNFNMLNSDGSEREKNLKLLNEADIILMKGVVSTLENNLYRKELIKNVASSMEPGSLLLYIESETYAIYFENEYTLRLIFHTKTDDSTSSESENSVPSADSPPPQDSNLTTQSENTTSQSPRNEPRESKPVIMLKPKADNKFCFSTTEAKEYGRGFSSFSNQEIYILVKKENKIE